MNHLESLENAIAEAVKKEFPEGTILQYTQVDSSPTHFGVFLTLPEGHSFEVSIKPV